MAKQAQIVREIEQMIAVGRLRPGQMLPTQKQLMSQYGVAMGTIQRALGRLQSHGVISATRGRGTVVSQAPALRSAGVLQPRIELLQLDTARRSNPQMDDAAESIQQELRAHGFELISRYELPESVSELNAWAEQLRAAIVVYQLPPRVLRALQSRQRPVVIYGELHDVPRPAGVSQVTVDIENFIRIPLVYMTCCRHERIAFVRGENTIYYNALGAAFDKAAADFGIGHAVEQWIAPRTPGGPDVDVVERYLQLPPPERPTAFLIEGGTRACNVIFNLQRKGIRVPEDVSVVAINGHQAHRLALPTLSRIETTHPQAGKRLAEVLLEVMKDPLVVREFLLPELVRGETCRPLDQPAALAP